MVNGDGYSSKKNVKRYQKITKQNKEKFTSRNDDCYFLK